MVAFVLNVATILNTLTVHSTCTALYTNKYISHIGNYKKYIVEIIYIIGIYKNEVKA